MELNHRTCDEDLEKLNEQLCNDDFLHSFAKQFDGQKMSWLPRLLAKKLVISGNLLYGKEPSYRKFRAVEVIARVPYQSWQAVIFALQTFLYANEERALELSKTAVFGRIGQDNETMHVVVISKLAKEAGQDSFITDHAIPSLFALFYYLVSWCLYLVKPRLSMELNYLFEEHAYEQYSRFLELHADSLKTKPMHSAFLDWYGRSCQTQYDFFRSVRNDELIHRNRSVSC